MTPINEDIRDIRGPIIEAADSQTWPYVVAAVVVMLAIAGVVAYVRRRRRALPSHERALRELAATRALIERDDAYDLSVRVSRTVRGYVEDAFNIHAPRQTTEELLGDLMRAMSPVAPYRGELGAFLELCDLAKYARSSLSRDEMTTIIERAESFVRATARPTPGAA